MDPSILTLLTPGQRFKSYRDLCDFLGEPIKTGNAQRSQYKEWARYFSFTREGYSIIITEHIPPNKTNYRQWKKMIDPLVLSRLFDAFNGYALNSISRTQVKHLILYSSEAFWRLGLCASQYRHLREGNLSCDLTQEEQVTYYNISFPQLYNIFLHSLERLKKKKFIDYRTTFVRIDRQEVLDIDDAQIIQARKKLLYTELGYQTEWGVMQAKQEIRELYYQRLSDAVEKELGFRDFYKVFDIYTTDEMVAAFPHFYAGMEHRKFYLEGVNKQSINMHFELMKDPPFCDIHNLVILQTSSMDAEEDNY